MAKKDKVRDLPRKEVALPKEVLRKLQVKADRENRTLKNYMEQVLINDAGK